MRYGLTGLMIIGALIGWGPSIAEADSPATQPAVVALRAERGGQDLVGQAFPVVGFDRWIGTEGNHAPKLGQSVTLYRWWTDTCPFCVKTLPAIELLRREFEPRGLKVVAVYHPKPPREVSDEKIAGYAKRIGYAGPIAVDAQWAVLRKIWLSTGRRDATSVSFLVDQKGVIRFVHPGVEFFPSKEPADAEHDQDYQLLRRAIVQLLDAPQTSAGNAALTRQFVMTCKADVAPRLPGSKRTDLWMAVPSSDAQQTISQVRVDSTLAYALEFDPVYKNRVVHLWTDGSNASTATVRFQCTRRAEHALDPAAMANVSGEAPPDVHALAADRLGVINDRIRQLASQITPAQLDVLGRARAIHDYVVGHMAYDKIAPGWGAGDTLRACQVGKGNCTDFHALFISLARAGGIPARFGIGFQLPPGCEKGDISGYHCWAEFWFEGRGWIPVDESEAWKHADRREFYFGNLDPDRVRLSVGRDVVLPGMRGEPLNYFLSPYAEVDGVPVKTSASVSFEAPGNSGDPQ